MRKLLALPLLLLAAAPAHADSTVPAPLTGIDIEERPGAQLPLDSVLRDQDGREVSLSAYVDGKHPVVLVLAYYQCPMLCSIVLNGLMEGMKGLPWSAGSEYRVVTISFDKRDTAEGATAKRQTYLQAYGRPVGERGWDFLVGDPATVKRIADTVGFHFRWDEQTKQFAHAAGAFVFTPEGRLSRTLYGITFPERDLRLALVEASQGKLGGAWDKVLLFCFHYDPNARGYALAGVRIMRAAGGLFALALGICLVRLWRRERPRGRSPLAPAEPK